MYRMMLVTMMLANAASAVHAMPPNDDFRRRTIVNAPGFVDNVNTQAATTELGDPDCAGRGPTVWYAFTPSVDMRVEVNTFGSDYDTTLSVHVGRSSALVHLACNDDTGSLQSRVRFDVVANVTYYLMVGAYGDGPGGNLVFLLAEAPPLGIGRLRITSLQVNRRTGVGTLSGTLRCEQQASVSLFAETVQRRHRGGGDGEHADEHERQRDRSSAEFQIAISSSTFDCIGLTRWSAVVAGAILHPGTAMTLVRVQSFDETTGDFATLSEAFSVQIR